MQTWKTLRGPLAWVTLWAALAAVGFVLQNSANAVLLLWLPSGVAVAALHATPERRWPLFLGLLFAVQWSVVMWAGTAPGDGFYYAFSTLVQSTICAWLGRRVLGGRQRVPRSFIHVAGLFGAAIAGCTGGAAIALFMRADQSLLEFSWWFLANLLGILIAAPTLLYFRQLLGIGPRIQNMQVDRWFLPALALSALAALLCLELGIAHLVPLLVASMVFVTVRYGEPASSFVILVYAAVATGLSWNGGSPAPAFDPDRQTATLVIQSWLLIMLATALPLAALLLNRETLEEKLRGRNAALRESVTIFDLAEELAGIGRWRYDLVSGMQEWSPRMLELNGLSPDLAPDPGDIRDRLPDGGEALFGHIAANRDSEDPYSFDYHVKPPDAVERILRISILNQFDGQGRRIALFAVAMDVTAQVRREEALELARGRAVQLAAEAQKLANTDPLTGLPNRRCSLARLKILVGDARRSGRPLSVVMFDIDHFKRVNDGYGHQTGDDVLVCVADLASQEVRSVDLVGRIGGEEFVWLLPGIQGAQAQQLAERLREKIEDCSGRGGLPKVTTSIGLATLRQSDSAEAILARADAALYEAKANGRNQVKLTA